MTIISELYLNSKIDHRKQNRNWSNCTKIYSFIAPFKAGEFRRRYQIILQGRLANDIIISRPSTAIKFPELQIVRANVSQIWPKYLWNHTWKVYWSIWVKSTEGCHSWVIKYSMLILLSYNHGHVRISLFWRVAFQISYWFLINGLIMTLTHKFTLRSSAGQN